ncbi:MAG TPA: hypothetical protein VHU83_21140 [Bryobacteraceae bacterium]|jgi:hypothetical protein|nr:hypothetical protein [Bryobacteraceae bacterium]
MIVELNPEDTRVINEAIKAGLIARPDEVVEVGVETLRRRLRAHLAEPTLSRQEAIRRMQEFGHAYGLSLGGPITRESLHDGHRY